MRTPEEGKLPRAKIAAASIEGPAGSIAGARVE
jgi:hypothetical protein